jgi:SAM domain (Sterile alpha motif)
MPPARSAVDIATWLRGLGLEQYEATFRANDIDAAVVRTLTADELKELGIASLGHRKKLLAAIAGLGAPVSAPEPALGAVPPVAYTPGHLAERILDARTLLAGERKQVTVVFADIKGSLELLEGTDPEEASRILDAAIRVMTGEIDAELSDLRRQAADPVRAGDLHRHQHRVSSSAI